MDGYDVTTPEGRAKLRELLVQGTGGRWEGGTTLDNWPLGKPQPEDLAEWIPNGEYDKSKADGAAFAAARNALPAALDTIDALEAERDRLSAALAAAGEREAKLREALRRLLVLADHNGAADTTAATHARGLLSSPPAGEGDAGDGWVPVGERVPEVVPMFREALPVLVFCPHDGDSVYGVYVGFYRGTEGWRDVGGFEIHPTHWRSLPPAPAAGTAPE